VPSFFALAAHLGEPYAPKTAIMQFLASISRVGSQIPAIVQFFRLDCRQLPAS
jgi:hypothetical protein